MTKAIQMMDSIPDTLYAAAGIILCVLVLAISFGICTRITKKEPIDNL